MVYLPYPQEFLRRGTFSLVELYRGNIPLYGVVYFALGEVLHGESGARMLNYLTLPGVLLATATLARTACRGLSRPVFYTSLAVCWVASCPILGYQASICYPDLGVALWSTLALQATMRLIETRTRSWVILAGVAAGMAAGTKFSGMYWIVLCGVAILAGYMLAGELGGGGRLDGAGESGGGVRLPIWRQGFAVAVLFATIAAVVFLPWLIRNWINTGDPMHPVFRSEEH